MFFALNNPTSVYMYNAFGSNKPVKFIFGYNKIIIIKVYIQGTKQTQIQIPKRLYNRHMVVANSNTVDMENHNRAVLYPST